MEIRSLSIIPDQRMTASGTRVIASFDLRIGDIVLRDMALVKLPRGDLGIWAPRSNRDRMPTAHIAPRTRDDIIALVTGCIESIRAVAA